MINIIKNKENRYVYEIHDILTLFFLKEEESYNDINNVNLMSMQDILPSLNEGKCIACFFELDDNFAKIYVGYYENKEQLRKALDSYNDEGTFFEKLKGRSLSKNEAYEIAEIATLNELNQTRSIKHIIKKALFVAIKPCVDRNTPWGMISGVRPTKKVYTLIGERTAVIKSLMNDYFVHEDKAEMVCDIGEIQQKNLKKFSKESISLYINIPFCPTRCLYCSFTSNSIKAQGNMVEPYLQTLKREIVYAGNEIKDKGIDVESIYIGGGTPTSLNVEQLKWLFDTINEYIPYQKGIEFTVEAGRPDTIDLAKLLVLKENNVSRISINPQTMNLKTLKLIGRNHTPEDIKEKFQMARTVGFDVINMDIIIGLPDENVEMVKHTMEELEALKPDNLTIHNMSLKRAATLNQEFAAYNMTQEKVIEDMFSIAIASAKKMGMLPYYLYRQKNMIGNMENVGYCMEDKLCFYNVVMMEERQHILALGAGAVSKVMFFANDRLERIFNIKGIHDYVSRADEILDRKKDFFEKYNLSKNIDN